MRSIFLALLFLLSLVLQASAGAGQKDIAILVDRYVEPYVRTRNILEPLGMTSSGHDGNPSTLLKNRAAGYIPKGVTDLENAPYLDWSAKTGNGSLYSTVEDLYKWDRALYTEKLLKKPTLERIFTDHVEGTGYGWFIGRKLNRRVVRLNGGGCRPSCLVPGSGLFGQ